jgi:apolipoprotein N-acyltransferase
MWYNTALTIDRDGVLGDYYKARPVHFFDDGIPGKKFEPAKTPFGMVGTPICFDCDYTAVIRALTLNGAEFIAAPVFDSSLWGAVQHLQHAVFFRIRAAENARWIVTAAASGFTAIIDPHGNVHKSLPLMKDGILTGVMARKSEITPFTRFGWMFPWLTLVLSAVLIAVSFLKREL